MGLIARIRWTDGVLMESAGLRFRSRFDSAPAPSGLVSLGDGTGSGQANDVYEALLTVATGTTTLIDLKGGGGETNVLNQTLAFTKVKGVELILTTAPAAGVSLRLGPQGATNAAQLWFQAATANFWQEVRDRFAMFDRVTGWSLDATHKVLAISNPGADDVSCWLRVIGVR
ncbi:MAG TPA: hypothetical protein VGE74_28230 [Gemmata sp.]